MSSLTVVGVIAGLVWGKAAGESCVRESTGTDPAICVLGIVYGPLYGLVAGLVVGLVAAMVLARMVRRADDRRLPPSSDPASGPSSTGEDRRG